MKSRRKTPPRIPTEEFSIEFGDVNGTKLYDILQVSQKEKKNNKKK
ncbi:hypothetical protein ACSU6B_00560 [Neobacillus sp. C211]|jgi:hypothetical protein|uniref:Uncharacterized protein n=1 Tax=Priestia megaterium TaxID=1404 RepID=A0A6H1P0X9_PRIMG|nr:MULTISPECIES: hypothetical protein [Bacillaceae]MBT2697004.1 hypothetical protein [Bacillus sp. ISL-40]MBT2722432.1 hypothetical protein [Bacillus sp. ISL-46]MBT2729411.1 hypothetical protein [Bacillus sp. ISL-75]MBT2734924.1 hypothetical protein [Bacillus sp. ISL-7]MBT2741444.1 hypothetical protein [Bacillus sp. ISL-77]